MKSKFLAAFASGLVLLFAVARAQTESPPAPRLKVGDLAPAIDQVTWVQGQPVTQLRPGQYYVFEFWATWCGPCIQAMPHLSELSHQYADKVVFVGVSILEDNHGPKGPEASLAKVKDFMAKNPGRMTYTVCVDGGSGRSYMAANWFRATGQNGIPCSIVVNGQGKVAWIGHPMELDKVLPRLLDGGFDAVKFDQDEKAKREQAQNERRARAAITDPLRAALAKKDFAGFNQLAENITQEHPEQARDVADLRTMALMLMHDEPALRAHYAVLEEKTIAGFIAMNTADMISGDDSWQKETYAACAHYLDFFLQHSTGTERNPRFHVATAQLYYRAGALANAVARQQRAIEIARRESRMSPEQIKKLEDVLARYLASAGGE